MVQKVIPTGKMIDALNQIREEKRLAAETLKEIECRYAAQEELVKARLIEEGMDKATGKSATVSLSEVVVANAEDWEKFYAFIKKTGYFHLLQKRISDPAFREVLQLNGVDAVTDEKSKAKAEKFFEKIGVRSFTKVNLNLRALKTA